MAQSISVKLSKFDNQPWGFRLQGGKDFAAPLTIQKVNGGSLAEKAGLRAGDAILKINGNDIFNLRHKEAQDAIAKAGNNFELVVSRGGVWKPQVTPLPEPVKQTNGDTLFTKTSLAANKQSSDGSDVKLINKQFNSPLALYSEESIAETLSAQAEVLAQGVLGVNFKKNEKSYNSANSEVFKMVQEIDRQPKEPEPGIDIDPIEASPSQKGLSSRNVQSNAFRRLQDSLDDEPSVNIPVESSRPAGLRPVEAPVTKPSTDSSPLSGAHTRCGECDRLIVGVFVRIKDKNLHVECFKCTICGTSLKNVGYYNINNKLYCDIHARQVARSQPPAPNVEPVTINPGAPIPSNAMTAEAAKTLGSTLGAVSPTKPVSSLPSFASNVSGGGINPPPVGGVRILPPSPAQQPLGLKTAGLMHNKVESEYSEMSTIHETVSYSSSNTTTSIMESSTTTEVGQFLEAGHTSALEASAAVAAPVTKPVSFNPSASLTRPDKGMRLVWPPPKTDEERPETSTAANLTLAHTNSDQTAELETDIVPLVPQETIEMINPNPKSVKSPAFPCPPCLSSASCPDTMFTRPTFYTSENPTFSPVHFKPREPSDSTLVCGLSKFPGNVLENVESCAAATNVDVETLVGSGIATAAATSGCPFDPNPGLTGLGLAAAMPSSGSYGAGVHSAPRRGRGILKTQVSPGVRIPLCASCSVQIRGPFVTAMNRTWCPEHFVCGMPQCRRHLQDVGFVEEKNELYCEACFENYLAPVCNRCQKRVKGDCLNAINKQFHPECFACAYCGRLFGNNHFYLEDGLPYCEADWNELFTTKCHACGYPIEAGDRWVEAMNNNYHSQCFNCVICKKNLEGLSFLAKGGRPMCKSHAH